MSDKHSMPRIIAITGCKRAGKDTIAEHLARTYGYRIMKFAAPLKAATMHLFGFDSSQLEETKDVVDEHWGFTPRKAMQVLGTEMAQYELPRHLPGMGRELFVRTLLRNLSKLPENERIVISDMRFKHEHEALKREFPLSDVLAIRVIRPGPPAQDEHASETEHTHICVEAELLNDGTPPELFSKVDALLRPKQA